MKWLQTILSGAVAGFSQSEQTPGTSLSTAGIYAGLGALAGLLSLLAQHPAIVAGTVAADKIKTPIVA